MRYYYHGNKVLDFIREFNLNFTLGNVVKYIARCDNKNDAISDLKKAYEYLGNEIAYRESRKFESHTTPETPGDVQRNPRE